MHIMQLKRMYIHVYDYVCDLCEFHAMNITCSINYAACDSDGMKIHQH